MHRMAVKSKLNLFFCGIAIRYTHNIEKDNTGSWIILDYNDIIVHVFHKDARDFYKLENLWADGEPVDISEYLKKD